MVIETFEILGIVKENLYLKTKMRIDRPSELVKLFSMYGLRGKIKRTDCGTGI